MKILVTGGAGFIGSALIRYIMRTTEHCIVNVDKLTYAGNLESLESIANSNHYFFEWADICDLEKMRSVFNRHKPDLIMHLAAESHVDRSIDDPSVFIKTNVVGTFNLLEVCKEYFCDMSSEKREVFRFHHISTDEVYGDLVETEGFFTETTAYSPGSPYSASKASSDHLVRAWGRTFGLPIIISNCSNNYGPYHFPEKLIPITILNAVGGNPLRVYGEGKQVRDWLFVEDHAKALYKVATEGKIGETYNIGGNNEMQNKDVVNLICELLDELRPPLKFGMNVGSYKELICYVADRPGHDLRYAIDASKINKELGWSPEETFESGIRKTVNWFLENLEWSERVQKGNYNRERLGIGDRV